MRGLWSAVVAIVWVCGGISVAEAQTGQPVPQPLTSSAASTPPSPPGSNKGGELRGLDRADQAAGEHGQQGRENARAAQGKRPAMATPPMRAPQGGHGRR